MARQRCDGLLADVRILGKATDERVPEIVPAVIDLGRISRDVPSGLPFPDRLPQVEVVEGGLSLVASKPDAMLREGVGVGLGVREPRQPPSTIIAGSNTLLAGPAGIAIAGGRSLRCP